MTSKRRAILGIALVEVLLAGIWIYLSLLGSSHPERASPEFDRVVAQTMGSAMGFVAAFGIFLHLIARKQARDAAKRRR